MFPVINPKETGINLRRIMNKRGISAKKIQEYLNLASVQSVYNWCNGTNLPTLDNLYALSQLFQLPIDYLIRGNRQPIPFVERNRRIMLYYNNVGKCVAA